MRANKKYGYRYPEGKIEMSKIEKDRIRYMEGIITRKKTMNKIYFLRKGKYIASVKILDPEV